VLDNDITGGELTANSLTYPTTITGTVYSYSCINDQISDASGNVTLQ
jgi:hypothetical protein